MNPIRALKAKPERLILAVILLLVFIFGLGLYQMLFAVRAGAVVNSQDGVWDLRGHNLSDGSVKITGKVSCIPGALLTPGEYDAREAEAVLLDDAFPEQFGTSRLVLRLPDDGWYTLSRISLDYAMRLYVNGEELANVGTVGDTAATTQPNVGRLTFTAKAEGGVITLVQQSANFVHRTGGYHGNWLVGGDALGRKVQAADGAILLEMGAYVILGVLHLLLFLLLPSYKPNLYFALYCFTWFLRMGTTGTMPFTVLLPGISWSIKFRLEYATVAIAVLLAALILWDLFPGVVQRWFLWMVCCSNVVFLLLCMVLPTVGVSWLGLIYLLPCIFSGVYFFVRMAVKVRRPSIDQGLFLVGVILMVCAGVRDIVCYYWFLNNPSFTYVELTQLALLAFALLAGTSFVIATMRQVQAARDAEQRLATENTALEQVNRLKTDLMQTLSHELRTPLAVMSGYAQLSEKQLEDGSADDETGRNLRVISREAQRLADLAGGLLQTSMAQGSRQRQEGLPVITLFKRAEAVCRPILAKRGNRLAFSVPEDTAPVWVNSDLVHQVLLNLITNASRYTKDGVIALAAQNGSGTVDSGFVVVTVRDSGRGIDPAILPHALEPNVSDGSGSGLGLAICKQVIEDHGGRIEINAPAGGGTHILFTLPTERDDDNG